MFDHVAMRASERDPSERFYRTVLERLSIEPDESDETMTRWDELRLLAADDTHPVTRELHIAFVAPSRRHVEEFWRAGIDAGYEDDGAPGERPQYTPSYFGAFLRDPDANSVEAVHHADTRRGGHIDHLWIGVGELAASEAFYTAISRHTGLRTGRRWDAGRQYRGAWATFSIVADGRAPTRGLQLGFPAPDRQAVRDFHEAALAAGARSAGTPTERGSCYAACVLDPDGARLVSVYRGRSATPAN